MQNPKPAGRFNCYAIQGLTLGLFALLLTSPLTSRAQNRVFFEDWETDHTSDGSYTNFTVGGNSLVNYYYDYSTLGIPLSPHSATSSTHALKLCSGFATNSPLTTAQPFPTGISVSPVHFGITDNFEMRWDQWYNFNGPAPGGGSGSSIVGGGGYGTYATNAQVAGNPLDGVAIGDTMDGGSSADFRVYSFTHPSSYQDGDYQIGSDGALQTTHGDPTSGFVYAGGGFRNNTASTYYTTNFPGQPIPAAEAALYPQQTGTAANGTFSFKWHEVALAKIANVITYKVDGILIATVNVVDAGTSGGSNIFWEQFDINGSASVDPNFTNLNFMLVDNVRITNFANVVSVSTTNTAITDGSGVPGIFTITRTASGTPLTVSYTMTGSATNGVEYVDGSSNALSGTITFSANATSTNIFVYGVATTVPKPTENIILNINSSPNYTGAGNATINLINTGNPQLTITNLSASMYERTNDLAVFQISRLGNTNTASFPINLTFSGTAAYGVNFYTNIVATFEPGISTTNISVYPIEDHIYTGNKIITVSIAASTGGTYSIGTPGSATVTLRDEDTAPETVLWSDNFNTDTSANWTFLQATADNVPDNTTTFGLDYFSFYGIPPSPHGGGDTHGLVIAVNKLDVDAAAAAVNVYPTGQSFSGNYALRFDMWLNSETGQTTTTEYALAGVNHSGTKTNWFRSGGITNGTTGFDGIWYTLETDAQASPNFQAYSSPTTNQNPTALTLGTNSSGFTNIFQAPPFLFGGSPAVSYNSLVPGYWSDVEVSQIGKIITLRINQSPILSLTNSTSYTSGDIMLGYLDAFDSIGVIQGFGVFDNVRVVRLNGLQITSLNIVGANVLVDFSFDLNDTPAGFTLQSSSSASGGYTDTGATIVQTTPGHYEATVPKSANSQFYRVRHL